MLAESHGDYDNDPGLDDLSEEDREVQDGETVLNFLIG